MKIEERTEGIIVTIEARTVLPEDVTEGLVTRQIANDVISSLLGGVSDLTHECQGDLVRTRRWWYSPA